MPRPSPHAFQIELALPVDEASFIVSLLHSINEVRRLEPVGQRALASLNHALESAAKKLNPGAPPRD